MESWSFCNFYFKSASFISRSKSETNTKRKTEIPLEIDSRCSCIISPAMANDSLCTHWLANDHQLIKQQLSHRSLKNPQDNKMKTPSCFYSYPTKCRWTCCVSSKVSKKSPFWDIIYSQIANGMDVGVVWWWWVIFKILSKPNPIPFSFLFEYRCSEGVYTDLLTANEDAHLEKWTPSTIQ